MTPLAQACTNGSAEFVDLLLKAGANPNTPIGTGETPLMTCARTGNADAVRMLLVHGADVNAKEPNQNQTALMWAAAQQHPKVLQILIEANADLKAHTKSGFTALHFAARVGDMESTRTLLDAGVDVNIKSQPDRESGRGQGPAAREREQDGRGAAAPGRAARAARRNCRWRSRRARRHKLPRQHGAARRDGARPGAARAVPAGSRGRSQRPGCRIHSASLGRGHVGKRTGESRLWVCRSDRRNSGSRSQAAARQGAAGARREPESSDDGPSTGIRRHGDRRLQRCAWRDRVHPRRQCCGCGDDAPSARGRRRSAPRDQDQLQCVARRDGSQSGNR